MKVGLITDIGQLNDHGFNELAYNGLKRAERELGVKGRVVESKSAADYVPNMSTLARQGYDLIIGVGFAQGDAIATTAKKYPDTKFAIVDVDQASLKGKPAERGRPALPRAGGRATSSATSRLSRRSAPAATRSAPSVASRSRPSTATSRGTRRARMRPCPGSRSSGATRRTGTTRRSARSWRSTRSRPARTSSSRSPAAAASVRSRRKAAGRVGDRGRRRPVVPRPARADERAQGRRQRRLPDGPRRFRTAPSTVANATFGLDQNGVGLGTLSPNADKAATSRRRRRSRSRSPTGRSRTSRRTLGRSHRCVVPGVALAVGAPRPGSRTRSTQAVRTEWTGGRCAATGVQVAPASPEPNTSPDVAPK